jgi:hypothetical protein
LYGDEDAIATHNLSDDQTMDSINTLEVPIQNFGQDDETEALHVKNYSMLMKRNFLNKTKRLRNHRTPMDHNNY